MVTTTRRRWISPTTGVKLRGPERSEGHVSFNSLVGLPLGFLASQQPRLPECLITPSDSSTPVSSQSAGCSEPLPSGAWQLFSASATIRLAAFRSRAGSFRLAPVQARHLSVRSREPRPRQAPLGAAARNHSSTRIPEPFVAPSVAVVESHESAGSSPFEIAHQPRRTSSSTGTTPSSTKTTGTGDDHRCVQVTSDPRDLRSNRRALQHQPERRLPTPGHRARFVADARRPIPVVPTCGSAPSREDETSSLGRIDSLSGR
jgi:hypothetical protein